MDVTTVSIIDAGPEHFPAILRIERDAGAGSVVALTEGLALEEALGRGHYLVVAMAASDVAGWAWFSADLGRGGEEAGLIYRVGVARGHERSGVGRALVEHAQAALASRGCTRVRATVAGDDGAARAFLAALGYAVDAVTMERPL